MTARQNAKLTIVEIPHSRQRYETIGDWIPSMKRIHVSRMKDRRHWFLTALHEMIEMELCRAHGISDKVVVAWDKKFERDRKKGLHGRFDEPGADPKCPYRAEHEFATAIEMQVARRLKVSWPDYGKAVAAIQT